MKAGSGGGGGGGGGGKVKRQVWTATAIEAFSEGLCQVLYILYIHYCYVHVCIRLHPSACTCW